MDSNGCIVQDSLTRKIIGHGTEENGLYYVDQMSHQSCTSLAHGSVKHQLWTWHHRLGHTSLSYLERLFPSLAGSKIQFNCEACILAKSHRHCYPTSTNRAKTPFVLINSDVWGPLPVSNNHGFSYYVIFIDDCTRMSQIYFLKKNLMCMILLFYSKNGSTAIPNINPDSQI